MKDKTDITIILDRSGSMESVKTDTVGGFNSFLNEQKSVKGEAVITLNQFDNEFETVYEAKSVGEVPELTTSTFVPRGGTALYDAIGRTINAVGARLANLPENDRPNKVVVVILTDGEENQSKEFNSTKISEMINRQRDAYQWEFVFLGANQDAIAAARSFGIQGKSALSYAANAVGTRSAFESVSKNLVSYRTGTKMSVDFEDEDRAAQRIAGVKH